MSGWSIPIGRDTASGCVEFSEPDNSLWLGTQNGEVVTLRLSDSTERMRGAGYTDLVGVIPCPDGLGVVIVERQGGIFLAPRRAAGKSHASLLIDLQRPLAAARLHPDGNSLLVLEQVPPPPCCSFPSAAPCKPLRLISRIPWHWWSTAARDAPS